MPGKSRCYCCTRFVARMPSSAVNACSLPPTIAASGGHQGVFRPRCTAAVWHDCDGAKKEKIPKHDSGNRAPDACFENRYHLFVLDLLWAIVLLTGINARKTVLD